MVLWVPLYPRPVCGCKQTNSCAQTLSLFCECPIPPQSAESASLPFPHSASPWKSRPLAREAGRWWCIQWWLSARRCRRRSRPSQRTSPRIGGSWGKKFLAEFFLPFLRRANFLRGRKSGGEDSVFPRTLGPLPLGEFFVQRSAPRRKRSHDRNGVPNIRPPMTSYIISPFNIPPRLSPTAQSENLPDRRSRASPPDRICCRRG